MALNPVSNMSTIQEESARLIAGQSKLKLQITSPRLIIFKNLFIKGYLLCAGLYQ
jgi:hypothetical protein